ncbi:hypothetical protein [Actinomadura sp. 7K507]|uniref:hypothetical protein n=1 Tax=Actinomadura sp. 7K507 TaxID=2530365 RepID=UPI001FB72398|nr:hypothetical protein [Actinomadura sp. 7K507]
MRGWRCGSRITGCSGTRRRRRYRGDTLILESEWETPEGTVRLIDFMPPRGEAADVVRIVEGVSGRVPMHMALRLRFDYGRIVPWVRHIEGERNAIAGPDAAWLKTPVELRGRDLTTYGDFTVAAGERVPFVLTYMASHKPRPTAVEAERALRDTELFWSEWMRDYDYAPRPASSSSTPGARCWTACIWRGRRASGWTRTPGTSRSP